MMSYTLVLHRLFHLLLVYERLIGIIKLNCNQNRPMIIRKKNLKITLIDLEKVIGLTVIICLLVSGLFVFAEPGMLRAATTQSVVVTLSVLTGASLTVDNNLVPMNTALGVVSNTATASSTFIVTTNNALGYTLKINASSTAPAMQSLTSSIPDASPTPGLYPGIVPAASSTFAFSAYSSTTADVSTATFGTGAGAGGCSDSATTSPSTTLKYRGFAGSTQITIASSNSTTTTSGTPIVVCYMVAQNGVFIPSGNYNATIVTTATTN